jgi:RNA polymerase sporulation-specific sigma factor
LKDNNKIFEHWMSFAEARASALVAPRHLKDATQEAYIGLWKAINTFIPGLGIKFNTYASVCIRNQVLNFISREKHQTDDFTPTCDIDETQEGTQEPADVSLMNNESVKEIIASCGEMTDREADVLFFRMLSIDPLTCRELAEIYDTSPMSIVRDELKLKSRIKRRYADGQRSDSDVCRMRE